MNSPWPFVFLYVLAAFVFAFLPIGLAKWWAPRKPSAGKQDPYECGVRPSGEPWIQFKSQYYVYALAFLVFDVEVAFLFPWAVAFKKIGWLGLFEVFLFLAIVGGALFYAWKKQHLKWE